MLHIFNSYPIDINQLAYANWLFVIPSLFFSLRTWISGKGWFAILGHSIWNLLFFSLSCNFQEAHCSYSFDKEYISIVLLAGILLTVVYLLMKRRHKFKKIEIKKFYFYFYPIQRVFSSDIFMHSI